VRRIFDLFRKRKRPGERKPLEPDRVTEPEIRRPPERSHIAAERQHERLARLKRKAKRKHKRRNKKRK